MNDDPQSTRDTTAKNIRELGHALKVHWIAIAVCTLLGVIAALGWTALQPKAYTTAATGVVSTGATDNLGLAMAADSLVKSKATQYKTLAMSPVVAKDAAKRAGLSLSPEQALGRISASVPLDTAQLEIRARGASPDEARKLADAWLAALAKQVADLEDGKSAATPEAESSESKSIIRILPTNPATLPSAPSSPNLRIALAIGLLAGLVLGAAYALIKAYFDRRIRSADILAQNFDIPVVGTIPVSSVVGDDRRILGENTETKHTSDHRVTEAFKELRTNVQFMNPDHPPRIFTVTSALPGDGKSTVADNIALNIAAQGETVFLVDADLRRPTVAKTFELVESVGLTDVVVGRAEVDDVLQQIDGVPNLYILGAGPIPPTPSELVASERMRQLMTDLASRGTVIIDAPPLLPVTDAAILAARFDGALIVVQAGSTTVEELGKATSNLDKVNARVLGAVLNRVPTSKSQASRYNYYGYSYYSEEGRKKKPSRRVRRNRRRSSSASIRSEAKSSAKRASGGGSRAVTPPAE